MKLVFGIVITFFVLMLTVVGGGYWWYQAQLTAANPGCDSAASTECAPQTFIIPKGQSVQRIGERLQEAGFIKNELAFRAHVRFSDMTSKLQAGSFKLNNSMTTPEIAIALTQGTEDIWITLLEGWRSEEIAEYLSTQELELFDEAEFLELAAGSEGYLYPDTYLIPRQSTADDIYTLLTNTYQTKITEGLAAELAAFPESEEDVLIMASIIEREARGFEQMQQVAGILWNRLEIGMPLQADATLQYARGYDATADSWWPVPLAVDRERESPFNSYLNPGLPPAPIANPGAAAIEATLTPIDSDYVFYIHAPDGSIYFAETLEQHNANIQKYLR